MSILFSLIGCSGFKKSRFLYLDRSGIKSLTFPLRRNHSITILIKSLRSYLWFPFILRLFFCYFCPKLSPYSSSLALIMCTHKENYNSSHIAETDNLRRKQSYVLSIVLTFVINFKKALWPTTSCYYYIFFYDGGLLRPPRFKKLHC